MKEVVIQRLTSRLEAYSDLLAGMGQVDIEKKLDITKNKNLAEHLWCVIGARESYCQGLRSGSWNGFICSLNEFTVDAFAAKLDQTAALVRSTVADVEDWTQEREELLILLHEHEVMHEGQIIRQIYAMNKSLPDYWYWA